MTNPWYAHYPGDYLRDTAHLSLAQHGAYRLLLDHYYATGAALPADAGALYRICRAFDEVERKAVDFVVSQFFELRGDGYHNARADRELVIRAEHHERLSRNGQRGAQKRWKDSPAISPAISPAVACPQPQPQPKKEKKNPAAKPAPPADPRFQPFVRFASGAFEAKHGAKPSWQGKDWKGLQNLLASNKSLGSEELQARWQNYLASTEAFTVKQGGSLSYFCDHADSFLAGPILERNKPNGKKLTGDALTEANLRATGFVQ